MFKTTRARPLVGHASACAILFLLASPSTGARHVRAATTDGAAQNQQEPAPFVTAGRPFVTAERHDALRPAGKILDLATSGQAQHHRLTPRRLNSTSALARLVQAGREQSRARSSGERRAGSLDERHAKCAGQARSRHFGDILKGARGLVSSGLSTIEQRAGGLLQLGSGLLAALIPLASLLGVGSEGGATGAPPRAGVASLLAPPQRLVQLAVGSNGIQSRVEYVMDMLENTVGHLPNFPRLHPQECVKRSICEAHNEPDRHGALGLSLRLLFPASNSSGSPTSEQDNMEFKVINKYRHAAGYGLARRLESVAANATGGWPGSGACREKYEDCLVSLLDVARRLVDLFVA